VYFPKWILKFVRCFRWTGSETSAFQKCLISHFDSDKSESAISKWATARTMAAKVYHSFIKCL